MLGELKDYPIRTVIKITKDEIKIGIVSVDRSYLYKYSTPHSKYSRYWCGVHKNSDFSDEYGFYLESIKEALDKGDIEILYPKQEIEDYKPEEGDKFMWIDNTDDLNGVLFTVVEIFQSIGQVGIKNHNGNIDSCDTSTVTGLLKQNLVALVDGPGMISQDHTHAEVPECKNNDGRDNCYACGGPLKEWSGMIAVHKVCTKCGK